MSNLIPMSRSDAQTDTPVRHPALAAPAATVITFFGGGFDTANLGVAALTESCVRGILSRIDNVDMVVFDHSAGVSAATLPAVPGAPQPQFTRHGGRWSRKFWRSDSLGNLDVSTRLGGALNLGAKKLLKSSAVLDISGGDSFTDIYGDWRYGLVLLTKQLALRHKIPLILLPQTYGPFNTPQAEKAASEIVRGSALAWARDARSYEVLKRLAGDAFDPEKHRRGTDVAFGLPARRPTRMPNDLAEWLGGDGTPLVGLNISGLILKDPQRARDAFKFKADYGQMIRTLVNRLLNETDVRLLLVPHVIRPAGHFESDPEACQIIADELPAKFKSRVAIVPSTFDQGEIKWIISQCTWFCGTRMHSTIAALSTGVPTAAIAYSPKTLGIFEDCDSGDAVSDPSKLDTAEATEVLWQAWLNRASAKRRLVEALVNVKHEAADQMDRIATCIRGKA